MKQQLSHVARTHSVVASALLTTRQDAAEVQFAMVVVWQRAVLDDTPLDVKSLMMLSELELEGLALVT
jgi:hypothetical protein